MAGAVRVLVITLLSVTLAQAPLARAGALMNKGAARASIAPHAVSRVRLRVHRPSFPRYHPRRRYWVRFNRKE
jgi:hypothetical protein